MMAKSRILIVEDEQDVAGLIKHAVERNGDAEARLSVRRLNDRARTRYTPETVPSRDDHRVLLLFFTSETVRRSDETVQTPGDCSVCGRVRDASNAFVGGATVTIRNERTSDARTTETDPQGKFFVGSLKPSTYTVKV